MDGFMDVTQKALKYIFFIGYALFFYLSIYKCFWKEGKSKVKLFLLAVLSSPFACSFEAVSLMGIVMDGFLYRDVNDERIVLSAGQELLTNGIYAVIYLLLIYFYVWLVGKWLKTEAKKSLLFLYLMLNTIFVLSLKGTGGMAMFSISYMGDLVDAISTLILIFAVVLFYLLDVRSLAEMIGVRVKVNWAIFTIPPAIFTLLCAFLSMTMISNREYIDDKLTLTIYGFASVIVFLFIWAFYVIIKNINATNEAVKAKDEVKTLSVEVMEALAHTIDAKDEYTRGHSVRVAKYSRMLAEKLNLSEEERENVYYMALLHDIGKIGVPNSIINSPTRLTEEEYAVIKTHPGVGFDILAEIKSRPDLTIGARWHHERYDGKGYPDRKAGTDIPFYARIIAVADTYDAMTSNRSYRKYMAQDVVRAEIEKNSGTQFDPEVASAMIKLIDEDKDYLMHE